MNRTKKRIERLPNPIISANFLSKWSFWWIKDLFRKGLQGTLEEKDIYDYKPNLDSAYVTDKLDVLWQDELKRKKPSVLRLLFRAYGLSFIPFGLLFSAVEAITRIAQPLCLGGLVSYFAEGQTDISTTEAYLYATGIALCSLIVVLTFHPFIFRVFEIGTKLRLSCAGLIYRKALKISKSAFSDGLSGRAINILSNDLGKFDVALAFFHDIWRGPTEAVVLGYFMYREIGISAVIGVAFMLSFIPLQAWAAKKAAHYRQKTTERTDFRVKLMNEIIQGIQVIKMYAWEKSFANVIDKIRKKEINAIRGTVYIYAALHTTVMISKFSVFLSLVSYVYLGDALTARKVFTVSSFFNVLNDSMIYFWPLSITFCAEAYVSIKRVQEFLLEGEEIHETPQEQREILINNSKLNGKTIAASNGLSENFKMINKREINRDAPEKGVIIQKACATWGTKEDSENIALDDINLEVTAGELTTVVGPVGAGKSTLLNVILGELELDTGQIIINGRLSYASQEPWLFESSLRDNIVFIEDFDERRYKEVLRVCALERDIQLMPHGDLTIVGERGISLSGGQKARVNLARAIYKKADIYLLDDPLSAVDAHVGKHIFEHCIKEFLNGKCRILITHQLQYLKDVEHLVLMNSGRIEAQGSYQNLQKLDKFSYLSETHDESGDKASKRRKSESESISEKFENDAEEDLNEDRKEFQAIGSVKLSVYKSYFKSLDSYLFLATIIFLFIAARVMFTGVDYFVSRWVIWEETVATRQKSMINNSIEIQDNLFSNGSLENATAFVNLTNTEDVEEERQHLVIIYTVFLGVTFILYLMRTFGFFSMCLRISLKIHDNLFRGITRASMYFFNTNPSGRILNRFSKDMHTVDTFLPEALIDTLQFFTDIAAVLIIVVIANFWLVIPAVFIAIMFGLLRHLYISTSRSVKRIESMTRSPIYSHTNQTFQGLATIRALQAQSVLEKEFHEHQNNNTAAWFLFLASTRAFAIWLDIICVIYIFAVTFSFLALNNKFYSGDVGLAIMQCITMVGMCQWGMRQTAELENQMTSVERVFEYIELPSEPPLETPEKYRPSEKWPSEGKIEFNDLYLKYSAKDDYILKGLNFTINSKEKIGIVGRTGAGKSSIIQSIFRLAINDGVIKIDDVDINVLGLHDLRSKISIIPQDPVLFSGTLRYNLDPFEQKPDNEIWKALEEVELKSYATSLIGGLNSKVSDGGSNFSMGQRQLVCLARAILRQNKILILDEATANVDPETDKLIQQTIRTKFSDCTVLTIAHRLHTVMDSDRILVMDAGYVVEIGHPFQLLQNPNSYLRKLVEQTGSATAKILTETAERSLNNKSGLSKDNTH